MAYEPDEESIYKIVPREIPPPEKPPRYKSAHNPKTAPSYSTFRMAQTSKPGVQNLSGQDTVDTAGCHAYIKGSAHWGPPLGSLKPDPTKFVIEESKRNPKVDSIAQVRKKNPELLKPTTLKPKLKPDVPRKDDKQPVCGLVSEKNYIVANAVEAILAAPPNTADVDPDEWKKRPTYGKVPPYLTKIKHDISEEYEYIKRMQEDEEKEKSNQIQLLSQERRQELIEGLKAKWEQTNRDYQATTHLTKLDTLNKVKRKEHNEAELAVIEKYIDKLAKAQIYVDTTK